MMVVARAILPQEYQGYAQRTRTAPRRLSRPRPGVYLCVFGICLALFGANAVLQGLVTASAARADALAAECRALRDELAQVEVEIAYLSSSPRIAQEAVRSLAMHTPDPAEYRFRVAEPHPAPAFARQPELPSRTGLIASLGDWLRSFGRTAAAD